MLFRSEVEPEGGRRCTECFILRLEKTARHALEGGFDRFTTTLSVSPYKDYKRINSIRNNLAERYGIPFVDIDFKKKGGAQRSVQMAKEYGRPMCLQALRRSPIRGIQIPFLSPVQPLSPLKLHYSYNL